MLMLQYDSPNLTVSGVKLWTVVGPQLRRKEVSSFALQLLDCVECKMHLYTVLLKETSSSAIAEGPRNALSQLKSCQLLHNCTKNHI